MINDDTPRCARCNRILRRVMSLDNAGITEDAKECPRHKENWRA